MTVFPSRTLTLTAPLLRLDIGGVRTPFEVEVEFLATQLTAGCSASYSNVDGGHPAEAPEVDYTITRIAFPHGVEPGDAPGPLTEAELATIRAWFEDHAEKADDAFDDAARNWRAPE